MAKALPGDYDTDPDRCLSGQETVKRYVLLGDVHEPVAGRFTSENLSPTLDLGCGDGRLSAAASANLRIFSLDLSATMLRSVPSPRIRAAGTLLSIAATKSRLPIKHSATIFVANLNRLSKELSIDSPTERISLQ